jgi:DNA polymerase-3 subunit alpha
LNLSSKIQLKQIQNFLDEKGETLINIIISDSSKASTFKLKTLRNLDRKTINIIRNKEISLNIH